MEKGSSPVSKKKSNSTSFNARTEAASFLTDKLRIHDALMLSMSNDHLQMRSTVSTPTLNSLTFSIEFGSGRKHLNLPKKIEGSFEEVNQMISEAYLKKIEEIIGADMTPKELIILLPTFSNEIVGRLLSAFEEDDEKILFMERAEKIIGETALSPLEELPSNRQILEWYLKKLDEVMSS